MSGPVRRERNGVRWPRVFTPPRVANGPPALASLVGAWYAWSHWHGDAILIFKVGATVMFVYLLSICAGLLQLTYLAARGSEKIQRPGLLVFGVAMSALPALGNTVYHLINLWRSP